MPTPNQQFAADLRVATAALATGVTEIQSLWVTLATSLADPLAAPSLFRDFEAVIASVTTIRATADRVVSEALEEYADRFGEYRPRQSLLN